MASDARERHDLLPGSRIAHYEILEELAHGGMGIVYRARDRNLNRDVALKRPWPDTVTDPSRRARFLREARATAYLSHPHIVPLYDAFEQDGVPWLALQYVDGKTLSELIDEQGPLPIRKVLQYGEELASALDVAHAHSILHRDLTPKNVIISREGWIFLTDFGLTRPIPDEDGAPSSSPTPSRTFLTGEGEAVGTPRYMSPEQVLGRKLDGRSDIFSLGVLLYEMAAGKPAIPGINQGEIIDNVLHYDPPSLAQVRPDAPSALDAVLSKALAKKPDDRYPRANEIEKRLREVRLRLESKEFAAAGAPPRTWPFVALASLVAMALVGAGLVRLFFSHVSEDAPPRATTAQLTTASGWEGEPAISPDGSFVAYVSEDAGNADIWLVDIEGRSPLQVTSDPASDFSPAWFPQGKTLAFVSDRSGSDDIWKTSMLGGSATLLVPNASSPGISPDGRRIAFARVGPTGTTRIAVSAVDAPDEATFLTTDADGLWDHTDPSWSPDGTRIAYAAHNRLWLISASGGPARPLTPSAGIDSEPSWSPSGEYIYFNSEREGTTALWRVPSDGGRLERVTPGIGSESSPSISGDGARLAYATLVEDHHLVLWDLDSGDQRLVKEESWLMFPTIAPDQASVVFVSDREGHKLDLWLQPIRAGTPAGAPRRLTDQPGEASHPSYSPDGKWIAYYRIIDNARDIWIVPSAGGAPVQFTDHPAPDIQPAWSPDGSLLAFASERSEDSDAVTGIAQIWVAPVEQGRPAGRPWQVTRGETHSLAPVFSPDGTEIAFVSEGPEYSLWIVPVDERGEPRRVATAAVVGRVRWEAATNSLLVSGKWKGNEIGLRRVSPDGGTPEKLVPDVIFGSDSSYVFDVAPEGRLLCFTRREKRGNIWYLSSRAGSY
jgi:Tol biopolymer transport system component